MTPGWARWKALPRASHAMDGSPPVGQKVIPEGQGAELATAGVQVPPSCSACPDITHDLTEAARPGVLALP